MTLDEPKTVIDRLLLPLEECLTLETAKRIVALRADSELQSQVDQLADKSNAGTLTVEERAQYGQYIQFSQFVSLLQIHARQMIDAATRYVPTTISSSHMICTAMTSFFALSKEATA